MQNIYINLLAIEARLLLMRVRKLSERISSLKETSEFQHKLIDSIISIMSIKKKAEVDYRNSLENINRQLEKYIVADYGFLTQMVKHYQSFIVVLYQNQNTLIQSYETQVLAFLVKAKDSKFQNDIIQKVQFVDSKVEQFQQQIKKYKKLIRQNQQDLQLLSSEATFKSRINDFKQQQRQKMADTFNDLNNLKKINEQSLQQHVDGFMELTSLHYETIKLLGQYETTYLEDKASAVYDRFIQAFIGEGFFLRSLNNDIQKILCRVNEKKAENKKIAYQNLRRKIEQGKGIKDSLFGAYKKWTTPEISVDINEQYISPKIRDKWKRVCEYYNEVTAA